MQATVPGGIPVNSLAEIEEANTHDKQDMVLEYPCVVCTEPFKFFNRTLAAIELICVGCDIRCSLNIGEAKRKFYEARLAAVKRHPDRYVDNAQDLIEKFLRGEIAEYEMR